MKRFGWLAAVFAVLVLAGGCNNNGNKQNTEQVRVLNAVVDAEPLDVLVDDNLKYSALALGTTSNYVELSDAGRDFKIRSSANQALLLEKTLSFTSGANGTVVLFGKRNAINTLFLADTTTDPASSSNFKIRFTGLSPEANPVDIYLTAGDVSQVAPTLTGVGYGAVSDYVELAAGTYRIAFTTSGTKDVLFQSDPIAITSGKKLTVAVLPAAGGKLVNAVVLSDTGTFLPNPLGRLKAVNAVPDSQPLTFKADGAVLLASVPFTGNSSYVTATTGSRALTIEASNVPGSTIASLARQIDPAKDYTVMAVDSLAGARLVALADDNTLPVAGFAKARFVNALVGSTSVDVLVNFASQASGLALGGASGYYSLPPSLTYTITFATPGGVSAISTLNNVELDAGAIYTVYLFGNAAAAQVKVVRDR
jgi:hypothetical protein